MNVHAGLLKRNVVLKSPVNSRNAEQAKVRTYTTVTSARAAIKQTNKFVSGGIEPVLLNTDDVIIRYAASRAGITDEWLVEYDGKDHVIHSVEFLGAERNDFIKLICKVNG